MMPEWLQQALQTIRPLVPKEFVGQIEINVYKGGISNINLRQSFKDEKDSVTR